MKNKARARIGLVELHVTPRAGAPEDKLVALAHAAVTDGAARLRTVLGVLAHAQTQRLDAIVFPGWTLAGETVPMRVLAACGDRVVVLEGVGGLGKRTPKSQYPWSTYVVWRGQIVARCRQLLATAAEASEQNVTHLARELAGPRAFVHPTLGRTGLLVCGEPNVVREHAPSPLPELDTILNPAHTPSRLPAMQRKRAKLAAKGTLFTTANTHDGWTPRAGRARPAARHAAEWFHRGVRGARPERLTLSPGATLCIVELPG